MDKILALYKRLGESGVCFYLWELGNECAATLEMDGKYSIFMDFDNIGTSAEELSIVAHEGGHIFTGSTHKVDSPFDMIERHEYKADKWAIKKLVPKDELDDAVAGGCTDIWSLADHFGVTEDFMRKAVCWHVYGNLAQELYF